MGRYAGRQAYRYREKKARLLAHGILRRKARTIPAMIAAIVSAVFQKKGPEEVGPKADKRILATQNTRVREASLRIAKPSR